MHWSWNLVIPYWTQKCLWIDEKHIAKPKLGKVEKHFHYLLKIYGKGHRQPLSWENFRFVLNLRRDTPDELWSEIPYRHRHALGICSKGWGKTDLCRLKEWFTNRRWIRSSNIEQYTIRGKKYHCSKGKDWLTVKLFTKSLRLQTSSLQYDS